LYDWGISAYPVIITTFIFATYFTSHIAVNEIIGTHQWGNAMAISGVIIAILSPLFGAIADYFGKRKYWLGFFTCLMILSSAFLWFAYPDFAYVRFTLVCVIIGTIGLNISMVFYNALLVDITTRHYFGRISGWGWGVGYLGGLCILVIVLFVLMNPKFNGLNDHTYRNVRMCGPLVSLWTILFGLPLFFMVPEQKLSKKSLSQSIYLGTKELYFTFKHMLHEKNILFFLISQMIYIDGLNTLFAFGGIYAAGTFHMQMKEVLLFGIVMNLFAGIGSIILAWVDDWIGSKRTVQWSLIALILLGFGIVLAKTKIGFWFLACLLSLFVGPVQSSSRSLMTRLIPREKATEYFGFYVLSGKVSTFVGPWILGMLTFLFNSQRIGMSSILFFFIFGFVILNYVKIKPVPLK